MDSGGSIAFFSVVQLSRHEQQTLLRGSMADAFVYGGKFAPPRQHFFCVAAVLRASRSRDQRSRAAAPFGNVFPPSQLIRRGCCCFMEGYFSCGYSSPLFKGGQFSPPATFAAGIRRVTGLPFLRYGYSIPVAVFKWCYSRQSAAPPRSTSDLPRLVNSFETSTRRHFLKS